MTVMPAELTPTLAAKRILVVCWILVAGCLVLVPFKLRGNKEESSTELRIDPNTAPWWELTVIPDVGPTLARGIVEHREQQRNHGAAWERRVFRKLQDLDGVKGVGPRRLERMEPYLHFPDELVVTKSPSPESDQRKPE